MLRNHTRIFSAAVPILMISLFLTCGVCHADDAFKVKLSSSTDSISAGEPVIVSVEITSLSNKPFKVPAHFFGDGAIDGTGLFFTITSDSKDSVKPDCLPARPEYPDATIVIKPGEYHGRKNFDISDCYTFKKAGVYTISAQFSSQSSRADTWKGSVNSNTVKLTVRESETARKAKIADSLVSEWLSKYDYSTAASYKIKLISMGVSSAPAIIASLKTERRLLPVDDLLDVLGSLPCRDSIDALIQFINDAPNKNFTSNMPGDFSSSSILIETAVRSLEKISGKTFTREKGDIITKWKEWAAKNREKFPPALPQQ